MYVYKAALYVKLSPLLRALLICYNADEAYTFNSE